MTENLVALKEIRLEHEEGAPCTAIREGGNFFFSLILGVSDISGFLFDQTTISTWKYIGYMGH